MSKLNAHYRSWLRRGIAADPSTISTNDSSASLVVNVEFGQNQSVTVTRPLVTPGVVRSLNIRGRTRAYPSHGQSVEPTAIPYLEFTDVDLPWRYSTVYLPGTERVVPWLYLLALEEGEYILRQPEPGAGHLPSIEVTAKVLPEPSQAWAWAHVEVLSATENAGEIDDSLSKNTACALARILSPRRLRPARRYTAFLVPLFKAGATAGLTGRLGQEPHNEYAWNKDEQGVSLPVYESFQFATTEAGDFLELVKRLREQTLTGGSGSRPYDARDVLKEIVGDGVLSETELAACAELRVPSALQPLDAVAETWPVDLAPEKIRAAIAERIDRPHREVSSPQARPLVGPPIYGAAHAGATVIERLPNTSWVRELNLDPSMRLAAGIGADCVRQHQTELLDDAWGQVEGIVEANRRLAALELSDEVNRKTHAKHIASTNDAQILELPLILAALAPQLSDLSAVKGHAALRGSSLSGAVLDPQWRRLTRSTGMISKRTHTASGRPELRGRAGLLQRNATGRVRSDPTYSPDSATLPIGEVERPTPELRAAIDSFNRPTSEIAQRQGLDFEDLRAACRSLDKGTAPGSLAWKAGAPTISPGTGKLVAERKLLTHPKLRTPIYHYLKQMDPKWILAGADEIAQDRLVGLQTCNRFIEALLVGANFEMARELLWHEYPTDQRGTYLQRFWDPIQSSKSDIPPITEWAKSLGSNGAHGGSNAFVLLVKSDVFRRYGEILVYALRGDPMSTTTGELLELPIFRGRLAEDVRFYGFEFSAADARSRYFVFQENPVGARFGLPESSSVELSWAAMAGLGETGFVDIIANAPSDPMLAAKWASGTRTGATAAGILLQTANRVLVDGKRFFGTS